MQSSASWRLESGDSKCPGRFYQEIDNEVTLVRGTHQTSAAVGARLVGAVIKLNFAVLASEILGASARVASLASVEARTTIATRFMIRAIIQIWKTIEYIFVNYYVNNGRFTVQQFDRQMNIRDGLPRCNQKHTNDTEYLLRAASVGDIVSTSMRSQENITCFSAMKNKGIWDSSKFLRGVRALRTFQETA